MTDRERLIDLLYEVGKNILKFPTENFTESLADYILSDGWIRPPCKVGDTVYAYCETFCVVLPYTVTNFHSSYMGKDNKNYLYWEALVSMMKKTSLSMILNSTLTISEKVFFSPSKKPKKHWRKERVKNREKI